MLNWNKDLTVVVHLIAQGFQHRIDNFSFSVQQNQLSAICLSDIFFIHSTRFGIEILFNQQYIVRESLSEYLTAV